MTEMIYHRAKNEGALAQYIVYTAGYYICLQHLDGLSYENAKED